MKKIIFALTALALGLSASADTFSVENALRLRPEGKKGFNAINVDTYTKSDSHISRDGEEEVYYSLAGAPASSLGNESQTPGMQMAMAFQIEQSFLTQLTNGQITEISYYTGAQKGSDGNLIKKATVFIASALDGTYLYTQETEAPDTRFTKVDVKLAEPFTIPADSKVFVGVYFNVNSAGNYPIVVDNTGHINDKGGWVGMRQSSLAKWQWDNIAAYYGFVTVGAKIKSSTFPRNDVSLLAIDGQPAACVDEPFSFSYLLQNNGVNQIKELTIEYGIEGEDKLTATLPLNGSWSINQNIVATIDNFVAKKATKKAPITVTVAAIDGNPNTASNASGSYLVTIVPDEYALKKNVVIEEFTCIQCVYCPVGYTAMEQIHEETTGSVIPVCIHTNSPGSDPMTAMSYNSVVNKFCTQGVPSTTINRTYSVYPYYEDLMETAEHVGLLPAVGSVEAQAKLDEAKGVLTVDTKTTFAFDYTDGDQNFILAYGITEDAVGPYNQKNGYSGDLQAVPGDWQKKPATVSLVYNDVARQLDKYTGITGSVPAVIVPGEVYEYTHDVKLVQAIKDLSKINLVVYLINRSTGAIENACMIKSADIVNGIGSVSVDEDADAPVEFFNLQGIRIDNPNGGIFIRRQGAKVSKELIK